MKKVLLVLFIFVTPLLAMEESSSDDSVLGGLSGTDAGSENELLATVSRDRRVTRGILGFGRNKPEPKDYSNELEQLIEATSGIQAEQALQEEDLERFHEEQGSDIKNLYDWIRRENHVTRELIRAQAVELEKLKKMNGSVKRVVRARCEKLQDSLTETRVALGHINEQRGSGERILQVCVDMSEQIKEIKEVMNEQNQETDALRAEYRDMRREYKQLEDEVEEVKDNQDRLGELMQTQLAALHQILHNLSLEERFQQDKPHEDLEALMQKEELSQDVVQVRELVEKATLQLEAMQKSQQSLQEKLSQSNLKESDRVRMVQENMQSQLRWTQAGGVALTAAVLLLSRMSEAVALFTSNAS